MKIIEKLSTNSIGRWFKSYWMLSLIMQFFFTCSLTFLQIEKKENLAVNGVKIVSLFCIGPLTSLLFRLNMETEITPNTDISLLSRVIGSGYEGQFIKTCRVGGGGEESLTRKKFFCMF